MGSEPVPFNYLPIIIFLVLGALFGIVVRAGSGLASSTQSAL